MSAFRIRASARITEGSAPERDHGDRQHDEQREERSEQD
jgi:hypothetical protein